MKKINLFSTVIKTVAFLLANFILMLLFAGCAAEEPNPLGIEKLHGTPPKQELMSLELDARGYVNGFFQPGNEEGHTAQYPISYTGDWKLIPSGPRSGIYTITTDEPGAKVDVVATLSRAVFDFWDYEFYDNPGRVSFYIDDQFLGTFDLARKSADGKKILNYQVATGKNTVATISMVLEEGRVAITGYLFNFLDERFPY
jgi:hypothetical protein